MDRRQPAHGRRAAAASSPREAPGRVRFVTRFVDDAEIPAIFRRADVVALPYRDAEHSGVLYTGLAFGKPLVLSAVGGFPEVAATGAARLVPPGTPPRSPPRWPSWSATRPPAPSWPPPPPRAAAGPYSWDEIARRDPRPLPRADSTARADDRAVPQIALLGLRRPDRLHARSATRWRCALLAAPAPPHRRLAPAAAAGAAAASR